MCACVCVNKCKGMCKSDPSWYLNMCNLTNKCKCENVFLHRSVSSFNLILSAIDPLCQRDVGAKKKIMCVRKGRGSWLAVNTNTKFEGVQQF